MGNDLNIDNEAKIKGSAIPITHSQIKKIYQQMNNSVCKIMHGNTRGTGFFCKIPFPDQNNLLRVLVTVNHVLDISKHKKVEFELNGLYNSILLDNSRLIYSSKKYDSVIIEIKKNELNTNYFLELDENINQNNLENIYLKKPVYILHYEYGEELKYSSGNITGVKFSGIDFYKLAYSCSTEPGSSGGPIINSSNFKVIGIHKGYKKDIDWNVGIFIKGPIKNFYKENKNKIYLKSSPNSKIENENLYENKEYDKEEYNREENNREENNKEEYEEGEYEEGEFEERENEEGEFEEREFEERENEEREYEDDGNKIKKNQINGKNRINKEQIDDQVKFELSEIHEHSFKVYDQLKELCSICSNSIDNIPGYKCEYCKMILCLDCGSKIIHEKRNEILHNHILKLKSRSNWICNICGQDFSDKCYSFFCELCSFDVCYKCYFNKNSGIIRPVIEADYSIHRDCFYYNNRLNKQCTFCTKYINNMSGYECQNCPIVLCINCSDAIFIRKNSHNLHEHDLNLKFREDWFCNLCESEFENCTSFHCEECDFDACYECYFED